MCSWIGPDGLRMSRRAGIQFIVRWLDLQRRHFDPGKSAACRQGPRISVKPKMRGSHHMNMGQGIRPRLRILGVATVFLALLVVACGTSAPPTPTIAPQESDSSAEPTEASPADAESTSTPVPQATSEPQPADSTSGRDSITIVSTAEPASLGALDAGCAGSPEVAPCADYATDPFTYISGTDLEVVPLSGVESWEQTVPDSWRFSLRPDVKFHNGEPWTAEAAKLGIDWIGDPANAHVGFQYTGAVSAEVVDELTVDVICDAACPIYPKTAFHTRFQAPQWFAEADDTARNTQTVGFGPYELVEWDRGLTIRMEAYEDYIPNPAVPEARAPAIQEATIFHREEPTVRAAMVSTGEADFASGIGFQNMNQVPVAKVGGTSEIFVMDVDTIWHPELRKKEVRRALVHAMDCPAMAETLYDGQAECLGNIAPQGTTGITPENSEPYEYNPDLARQLLEEAEYDPANEITIYVRSGRFYRNVEVAEATQSYWTEVGISADVQVVETAQWREISRTGAGQYAENPLDAPNQPAPPPTHASPNVYQNFPSNESLDYLKVVTGNMSCYYTGSQVCQPDRLEPLIDPAAAATGQERERLLTELADIMHEDVLVIPYWEAKLVYGIHEDLVFEPRYDRRVRLNMLRFSP
jgi:peptide/nickel transport system substrate-binding protein